MSDHTGDDEAVPKVTQEATKLFTNIIVNELAKQKGWSIVDQRRWWFGVITAVLVAAVERTDFDFVCGLIAANIQELDKE